MPCLLKACEIVDCILSNDECFARIFQPLVNLFCDSKENIQCDHADYGWLRHAKSHLGFYSSTKKIVLDTYIDNGNHFMEASFLDHKVHVNYNFVKGSLDNSLETGFLFSYETSP